MGRVGFLGELEKLIPQSPQRIRSVSVSADDVVVELMGVAGEHIKVFVFYVDLRPQRVEEISCVFPDTESVTVSVANMNCQ